MRLSSKGEVLSLLTIEASSTMKSALRALLKFRLKPPSMLFWR